MASDHNLIKNNNHLRKEGTDSKRGGYSASLSFPSFPHLPPLGTSPDPLRDLAPLLFQTFGAGFGALSPEISK